MIKSIHPFVFSEIEYYVAGVLSSLIMPTKPRYGNGYGKKESADFLHTKNRARPPETSIKNIVHRFQHEKKIEHRKHLPSVRGERTQPPSFVILFAIIFVLKLFCEEN